MSTNIKRKISPEGYIDLSFKAKGRRVNEDSYMSLALMILLLPASCTISSPFAFMTFDKVASRNEFQAGTAIIWVMLSLFIWAGIIYAYNHRRRKINGKLRIVPKVSVNGKFRFDFEKGEEFVVRSDTSLGYTNNISYVAVLTNRGESRVTDYVTEGQAQEIVAEIKKYR